MTRKGAIGIVYALAVRVATITAVAWLVLRAAPARADAVDNLIRQLEASSPKVRLAAALNLTKLGDAKALLPLAKALGNDDSNDVRAAAAVGLGKLVARSSNKSVRNLVLNALKKAAAGDRSGFVKQQAQKTLATLGEDSGAATTTTATTASRGGSIYVNIGPMSAKTGTGQDPALRSLMVKVASKTMGKVASKMTTTWPQGLPTKAQLAKQGYQGFHVDGTLNELKVTTSGSSATVSCKISMLLASFPDKSVFGFLSGGAKVQASSSPTDVALAGEDCVAAVVEDLIAKKIVPTINTKAGSP